MFTYQGMLLKILEIPSSAPPITNIINTAALIRTIIFPQPKFFSPDFSISICFDKQS